MRRALLLTLFGLSISCSRRPADGTVPPPSSAASAAVDDGLPSAANTEPLAADAPEIVVDRDRVLVDGAVVGEVKAMREAGRLQRLDAELDALEQKREAWKAAHPGAQFTGVALLRVPRDMDALIVKDVFQTAAFAGYPNLAFAVGTGSPRRTERILVDAVVPGPPGTPGAIPADDKVLNVRLAREKSVTLTWTQGATVVAETELPWREAFEQAGEGVRATGLATKVSAQWSMQRQHFDPQDRKLDHAIVRADDPTELRYIVAALDALYETKRTLAGALVPAFSAAFSPREITAPTSPPEAKAGPKIAVGRATVSGRLPPEVIQRLVRDQGFARFRACYAAGLARDPGLKGKVSVRFVIGKDGAVTNVADAGGDLPDAGVKKCIRAAFSAFSFPAPEGGIVTVEYPMDLSAP